MVASDVSEVTDLVVIGLLPQEWGLVLVVHTLLYPSHFWLPRTRSTDYFDVPDRLHSLWMLAIQRVVLHSKCLGVHLVPYLALANDEVCSLQLLAPYEKKRDFCKSFVGVPTQCVRHYEHYSSSSINSQWILHCVHSSTLWPSPLPDWAVSVIASAMVTLLDICS